MKIVLNPKYEDLRGDIVNLPSSFDGLGQILQQKRNVIRLVKINGLELNIKRYRIPIFINRIVYKFFRTPKAQKAYYNALFLKEKGFDTPYPIAYIITSRKGLLFYSYFISLQVKDVKEIRDYYFEGVSGNESFLTALARYTALLHESNILHLDYSPGNILYKIENGEYHFTLVDINRMKFPKVNLVTGCSNFCRLFEKEEVFEFIAKEYARIRGFDTEKCIRQMLKSKREFEHKKMRKERLKEKFK